jgi:di/tricarboxylate transporter
VFPPIGGIIAAPLILYFLERRRVGDHDVALETVKALMIGWGWAFVVRFGIGVLMILLWGGWALTN